MRSQGPFTPERAVRISEILRRLTRDLPADNGALDEIFWRAYYRDGLTCEAFSPNVIPVKAGAIVSVNSCTRPVIGVCWVDIYKKWHVAVGDQRLRVLAEHVPDELAVLLCPARPTPTTEELDEVIAGEPRAAIEDILGHPGRMISMSKSGYLEKHPQHTVCFNGRILDEHNTVLWRGDLDVTADAELLQRVADEIGVIVIRYERPPFSIHGPDIDLEYDPPVARFDPSH
jgi:hypothetical protein